MAEKDEGVLEEQAPNGANEETRPLNEEKMAEHHDGDGDGDVEGEPQEKRCTKTHSCITCLKEAPCCSLMALLLILFGGVGLALGTFFGSVRLRKMLDESAGMGNVQKQEGQEDKPAGPGPHHRFLFCVEYVGIGLAGGIVLYAVLVYLFICLSTRSSLVCLFGTHAKRMFAFVLNYICIVLTFLLVIDFLLIVVLLSLPAAFHGVIYYNVNWNRTDCVDLRHYVIYPLSDSEADIAKVKFGCGGQNKLSDMINNANFTLLCSLTALGGGILITLGLAWLLACLSARIAYLRPPCVAKCAQSEVNDPLCNDGGQDGQQSGQQCGAPDGGSFEVRL